MRIFTLLIACVFAWTQLPAQVVLVNSPADIAGPYMFSAAAFGADLTTGVWTGDAIFVDDGSANPTQGCNGPLVNAADIAGKIALIDRGTCQFGVKCLNAEMAGAIAAIVFNHTPGAGTLVMAPGDVGDQVTIPCVMLSYEDGQIIRNAIANGATVNISIGNIKFPNDIAMDPRSGVARPPLGTVPADQVQDGYVAPIAVEVTNHGLNTAYNIVMQATITKDGNVVYDMGAGIDSLLPDSSAIFGPAEDYDAGGESPGVFQLDYVIASDSTDGLPADNSASTAFYFSENVFCKGGWDPANNRPARTNAYTISGGGNIEFLSGFHIANGQNKFIDSVQFYVAVSGATLGDIQGSVNAFIYLWDDVDANGGMATAELQMIGLTNVEFEDPAATSAWVKVPVLDLNTFEEGIEIPADGLDFVLGVRYEGSSLVFFGFDENYDQTIYSTFLAETDLELPYIGTTAWVNNIPDVDNGFIFSGFFGSAANALIINEASPTREVGSIGKVNIFPNPVSTTLNVEAQLDQPTSTLEYFVRNAQGQLVRKLTRQQVQYDKVSIDVSDLPAGQYFLILQTDKRSSAQPFTIQR